MYPIHVTNTQLTASLLSQQKDAKFVISFRMSPFISEGYKSIYKNQIDQKIKTRRDMISKNIMIQSLMHFVTSSSNLYHTQLVDRYHVSECVRYVTGTS